VSNFKSGNRRALVELEINLGDVVGIEATKRIMDIIRDNITKDVSYILKQVDENVLSALFPYTKR